VTRYDLLSPRQGKDGKTRWLKVGAAFPRDKGGFSLVFDALPIPDKEGRVQLLMSEAKPREDAGYPGPADRPAMPGGFEDLGDSIPF
jgi:hypothetical protein